MLRGMFQFMLSAIIIVKSMVIILRPALWRHVRFPVQPVHRNLSQLQCLIKMVEVVFKHAQPTFEVGRMVFAWLNPLIESGTDYCRTKLSHQLFKGIGFAFSALKACSVRP